MGKTRKVSDETRVRLLLTETLPGARKTGKDAFPLKRKDLGKLDQWLQSKSRTFADFASDIRDGRPLDLPSYLEPERISMLTERDALLDRVLAGLIDRDVWVISDQDESYPSVLKHKLGADAPIVIYGRGRSAILSSEGFAVVGSRNADDAMMGYAEEAASMAAQAGRTVVSGGAKGIDRAAMFAALRSGGNAIGVLAEGIDRGASKAMYRDSLADGSLVLISTYESHAIFHPWRAMARNKIVYALSSAALVVNADLRKGGTWAGSEEALKELPGKCTVYVRSTGAPSAGLEGLCDIGAKKWPNPNNVGEFNAVLARPQASVPESARQLGFDF